MYRYRHALSNYQLAEAAQTTVFVQECRERILVIVAVLRDLKEMAVVVYPHDSGRFITLD